MEIAHGIEFKVDIQILFPSTDADDGPSKIPFYTSTVWPGLDFSHMVLA